MGLNKSRNLLKAGFDLLVYNRTPEKCAPLVEAGEPTVELDYSGLHIRMLYHLIGIDYRDECYVYEKSDKANKADRDRIKLASLIVINSDDRGI